MTSAGARSSLVLVVNSGSSSLKYQLRDAGTGSRLAKGLVERVGSSTGRLTHEAAGSDPVAVDADVPDHESALRQVLDLFGEDGTDLAELAAVGHRIVHGGSRFTAPTVVDDEVEAAISDLVTLAPLHNPAGLLGVQVLRKLLPDVAQVAVFDTAFHATMPAVASTYAIPLDVQERLAIRRYGFHGTSYEYVGRTAAQALGRPTDSTDLVICHIGNGASICAVRGGRSVDTSMGMTPLEGLVMGTRSGDLDPAILLHLLRNGDLAVDEVDQLLNKRSGLAGLCGSSDVREVRGRADAGEADARLALEIYAYRLRKYVGAYLAVLPEAAAIVFTGGVGENDAALRADVCHPLGPLGVGWDEKLNQQPARGEVRFLDDGTARVRVLVVPTDEEAQIALHALEVARQHRP